MTIFAPTDPGPARPPAPPREPAVRIAPHPLDLASCARHQTFADGCGRCRAVLTIRAEIRAERHTSHIRQLTRA